MAMESASIVTARLRIGFAIVEWLNVVTPVVIPLRVSLAQHDSTTTHGE
jgi:hypothetical protein